MKLGDVKKIALSLIEEINAKSAYLTDDDDIKEKLAYICNSVQMDLAQVKKISRKFEFEKLANTREMTLPADFYQLNKIKENIDYDIIGNTLFLNDDYEGTINVFYYAYPKVIDNNTSNDYELEIDLDAQNAMPYGIASDVLKADISSDYSIYESKYQNMKANLDPGKGNSIAVISGIEL